MTGVVLLPWPDVREAVGDVADRLEIAVYDATTTPPQDILDRVGLYVMPYLARDNAFALIPRMPRLRALQTLSAGVDKMWSHLPAGVALHNAAGVHDTSTAELALTLMLSSLRRIDDFVRDQGVGRWQPGPAESLADKRVMICGYGRIGKAVERRLAGFEVDVVRVASFARVENSLAIHGFDEIPDLLPDVDVVVLIVPLTPSTKGMVDDEFLSHMKHGALLVNVARGPVVVTDDLVTHLQAGRVRAALDVTDPEPLPADHALWHAPGVIISPHVGGLSSAFAPRVRALVASQLRRWESGTPLINLVTPYDMGLSMTPTM